MVQPPVNMGQTASLPKPGRRKSLRSFGRKDLSHTFALTESEERVELLNINQASEEELMTLPGVSREVARSVVEHRKAIGRFRKIEDLALVRGVGADRLEALRAEICVSRRNPSRASSRAQSYDSLRSTDSRVTLKSGRMVNINKANVFEMQCVHGVTQEIAAAIVHYRDKRGPFKQVEDLLKVRLINRILLDNISRFFTVNDPDESSAEFESPRPSVLTNGFHVPTSNGRRMANGGPITVPVLNGLPASSLYDIFELLSAYSPRPTIQEAFHYQRKGEPAVRIASWNLHNFSLEKASNPGIREVVCRTILENGWSIVAVQEATSVAALKLICDELNKPRLRRISEWKDRNYNWNFCMLDVEGSQLGYIYDSDGVIDIELISLTRGPDETKSDGEVLIATFKIGDRNYQLVNLKLDKAAEKSALNGKIRDLVCEEDMLVLFVDFSSMPRFTGDLDDWLRMGGLRAVLPSSTITSYLNVRSESDSHHVSNMLHNSKVQGQLTGTYGVVRSGLTHLAIPNGWNWGGPASSYCPVWTEFYVNSNIGTAL